MPLIQIFIVAFAVFALARAFSRFRAGELGALRLILWIAVWTAAVVVAVLPQTATWLAGIIGVGRGADAVVYISIIVVFYLVFRLFVRQERQEREITRLVRRIALDRMPEAGKEKKDEPGEAA